MVISLPSSPPDEVTGRGRFVVEGSEPAYLRTYAEGRLRDKVDEALDALRSCTLCPRDCRIDRLADRFGVCKVGRCAKVTSCFPHFGEEDVLRGWRGSVTIFFAWCNLRCVFCQNYDTSQVGEGQQVSPEDLAAMMMRLQEMGCHNINFVTPEHVVPQILESLPPAIEAGFRLPIVYNTSAYDGLHSIDLMDGIVDIYMPDFKLWDRERSRRFLLAPDYPEVARAVIAAMHAQVGDLVVNEQGLARRGLIVRHLVMPGMVEEADEIFRFLAGLSRDTYLNVMDQYHPAWKARNDPRYEVINRRPHAEELERATAAAWEAGLWRLDTRWRRLVV